MPTRLYQEYIKVEPNFIPVFSSTQDSANPFKWKSFSPHESFRRILTSVVEMLEKGSTVTDWSQWMSGAYGTGKTFASFTIKHILEDPIEDVEPYFLHHDMEAIWKRIKAIRKKGNILVVHRSSSSNITSQNKLFNTITSAVRKTLIEKGYKYQGAASRHDKVLSILQDPNPIFNFKGVFEKHKKDFMGYNSPEDVIDELAQSSPEDESTLDLLDTIINIAEEANYNWSSTPEEIIAWLDDVRKVNGLYAIIMMWDEFTEFFENNANNITGLQEIAQASPSISFYFFLITHSDVNQLIRNQAAAKKMQARFVSKQLTLAENTALTLLGEALIHVPELRKEWDNNIAKQLKTSVKGAVEYIKQKDSKIGESDFENLLPMHPYASYLLKFIAQDISSNQRTMFQFLSADYVEGDSERHNFKWFVENFGFEYGEWNLLTADYLWDYFFYANNINLSSTFMGTISYYEALEKACGSGTDGDYCRKVFKVALLLAAISKNNTGGSRSGVTSLLRSTERNIKTCFVGTPIENRVKEFLDYLEGKNVLASIDQDGDTLYILHTVRIDQDQLEQFKDKSKMQFPLNNIINNIAYGVVNKFKPTAAYLDVHCNIKGVTPGTAKSTASNSIPKSNEIAVFYLFAQNEIDQGKSKDAINSIYSVVPERCIVVDFTSCPLGDTNYESFITEKAKEDYFTTNQNDQQAQHARIEAENIIKKWMDSLDVAKLQVYNDKNTFTTVTGVVNLRNELDKLDNKFYPYGLESISKNDKVFATRGFSAAVPKAAMGKDNIPNNAAYLNTIVNTLKDDGIWDNPKYWTEKPKESISRMKAAVEETIENGFKKSSMVAVTDIWKTLTSEPYGLFGCMGAAFIMGFLLKEYADGKYYKQDVNSHTIALNYTDLCELIFNTVKGNSAADNQYIVLQKPEHIDFCKITGNIFNIQKDKRGSLSDIRMQLNIYLKANIYPLWSLTSYVDKEMSNHIMHEELITLIQLLCEFISEESDRDKTKIAEGIYAIYKKNDEIDKALADIVTRDYLRRGMECYIAVQKPELPAITEKLKITNNTYLSQLAEKFSADASYLWTKKDIDQQINNLYMDFRFIDAINSILTSPQKNFSSAQDAVEEKLNCIKLPKGIIEEYHSNLKSILGQLYSIIKEEVIDKSSATNIILGAKESFIKFVNEKQNKTFAEVISSKVDNKVSAEEVDHLYNNVPSGIFFKNTEEFIASMSHTLDEFRKKQKIRKLFSEWKKITDTASPSEWSNNKGIPLLCLFPDDAQTAANVFSVLNGESGFYSESAIDEALRFLKSSKMDILEDLSTCKRMFMDCFCGEYADIIEDTDVLSDALREIAGNSVYKWYFKLANFKENNLLEIVTQRYNAKYRTAAKNKIHGLTAEQAQSYLEELVETDPRLGIRILHDK